MAGAGSKGAILQKIRALMKDTKIVPEVLQAYIVPSADAHMVRVSFRTVPI